MAGRRQLTGDVIEAGLIAGDQRALAAPLGGAAKHIQRCAAPAPGPGQQPERLHHPRAETHLARHAGDRIAFCQDWRREMELQPEIAFELRRQLPLERAIGVKPGDLVFVFIGHQLEQIARGGLGQRGLAGQLRLLGGADALHRAPVALGIGLILVFPEEGRAPADHRFQRRRLSLRFRFFRRRRRALNRLRIMRRAAAPAERREVHRHRFAIQFDGFLKRCGRQRQAAGLKREAEHEHVRRDGIAKQRHGQRIGIDEADIFRAGGLGDGALDALHRQREIRVAGEVAGHDLRRVDHHLRRALAHRGEHLLGAGDNQVAAQHQACRASRNADGFDILRRCGDLHMRGHRAALLRQPGHVDHAAALALEMRRHAEDRADGDHAGAADAGDNARPRMLQPGNLRRRQIERRAGVRAGGGAGLSDLRAMHRDEGRAEPVDAGEILVAAGLVDAPLAPELGFHRLDRHAVRLHPAIAAALADELVDDDALVRVGERAAFAAAALFRRAGLIIDQRGDAIELHQLALHGVEIIAVMQGRAGRECDAGFAVFIRLIGDDGDALNAVSPDLPGDAVDGQPALMGLAAGHRDGVIEQDFVGQRDVRCERGADRHRAGVVIGAVAEILEHMLAL